MRTRHRRSEPVLPKLRRTCLLGLCTLLGVVALAAPAFAGSVVTVNATVLSRNECKFENKPNPALLSFGALSPGSKATASTTLRFRCGGSSSLVWYTVSQNGGLHRQGAGPNRMRHTSPPAGSEQGIHIPYSLALSPASGSVPKNDEVTVTVQGEIQAADFRSALPGSYADTVVLTLLP